MSIRTGRTFIALTIMILASSGCAYIGLGAVALSGGGGGGGGTPKVAPTAIIKPILRQQGDVTIDYSLYDANNDTVDIEVSFSTDGGSTFALATDAGIGAGSHGTVGLDAPKDGMDHVFVWDSLADGVTGAVTQAQIRIIPADATKTGTPAYSDIFTVGNDAPAVAVTDPGSSSGLVGVTYTLTDTTSDLCGILVEYSTDGGTTFQNATISVGSTANLPSDPAGIQHSFAWNSIADLGAVNLQAILQVTPSDALDTGSADATSPFLVQNNDQPVAFANPIPRQDGDIQIDFILADVQQDPTDVALEYSTDGGAGFFPMTLTPASVTTGLASDGTTVHSAFWQSASDIGGIAVTARARITPSDLGGAGTPFVTPDFVAGNDVPVITVTPITGNHDEGVIRVEFVLEDTTADPVDLDVKYSIDGWVTEADASVTVGVLQDVPTAPNPGITHAIAWNSRTDLPGQSANAELRITPSDDATGTVETGAPGFTGVFGVNNFDVPVAFIASPIEDQVVDGNVVISYLLFDSGSALLDLDYLEYSTDGVNFSPATECTGCTSPASQGTTGLTSSPGGTSHIYVWESGTDIPLMDVETVWLRLRPRDTGGQGLVFTMQNPFLVNNNQEPFVFVGTPPSPQEAGDIAIQYELGDAESDTVDITVTYSTDGGATFATATDAGTGDGTSNLTAGDPPIPHTFVWDSITDSVALNLKEDDVIVRIVPDDNPVDVRLGQGPTGQTAQFSVDNTDPPVVNNLTNVGTSGTIPITYDLYDAEPSPTVDLQVDYSLDGLNYFGATITNPLPEGVLAGSIITGQIPSNVAPGNPKSFQWDTDADIGPTDVIGVTLRIIPADTKAGTGAGILIDVANNTAPTANIQTPGGIPRGDIVITYDLTDTNSDLADITAEYSTVASSGPWNPATERVGSPSEGTTNLPTDPGGLGHIFVWDSVTDLGLVAYGSVWFRITPRDTLGGTPVSTADFPVNNDTLLPVARIEPVPRTLTNDVTINYFISDGDEDPADIVVEWQQLPTTWTAATEGAGSDGTTGLVTSQFGEPHVFVWDSAADRPSGAQANLEIRIRPQDNDGIGTSDTSNLFIRGNDAPSITINFPPPASTQSGLIEFSFDIADSTSDPVDLVAEYDAGSGFVAATISVGGLSDLPTDPAGLTHNFAWNSVLDLGLVDIPAVVFRITPTDSLGATGAADTVTFDITNNDRPIAFIGSPDLGDKRQGSVRTGYILIDGNDDTITLDVEYTVDGVNFFGATLTATDEGVIAGSQITGLSSTAGGVGHWFDWDSDADHASQDTDQARIRVTPDDGKNAGNPFTTQPFLVNNNLEPTVVYIDPFPPGDQSGSIPVYYGLGDVEADPTTVWVSYSVDGGGSFNPATISKCNGGDPGTIAGNQISGLPTSDPSTGGTSHCILWESGADLGGIRQSGVVLRLLPADNAVLALGLGTPGLTTVFGVDNTDPPSVTIAAIADPSTDDVEVTYRLFDTESDLQDIVVEFSTDNFVADTRAATECTASCIPAIPASEGTTGLSSSPGGTLHTFRWSSTTDLGHTDVTQVWIRITPTDTKTGLPATSNVFALTNNDAPTITISDITGIQGQDVTFNYSLEDTYADDDVDIAVYFRVEAGAWTLATAGAPSTGDTDLKVGLPGQGVAHFHTWQAYADLSTTYYTDAEIWIRGTDSFGAVSDAYSNAFTVDNMIDADLVLGRDNLLESAVDGRGLYAPRTVRWDGTRVIICDSNNNRVLILNSLPASNFQTADVVVGQADFTVNSPDTPIRSERSLYRPRGAFSDGTSLYVADTQNNRVLIWNAIPTANHAPADYVLGQSNFISNGGNSGGLSASSLWQPRGIVATGTQLYVADRANHRILIWNIPGTWTNKEPADYVLGQLDFDVNDYNQDDTTNAKANSLYEPRGIYTDGTTLYCADTRNHRVLMWTIPAPWTNGRAADNVVGQPNLTSSGSGSGLNQMFWPYDATVDDTGPNGQLYVADRSNLRVLIWNDKTPVMGSSATWELEEDTGSPDPAAIVSGPAGVASTGSQLLISEQYNHRVKIHDPIPTANFAPAQLVFGQRDFSSVLENHSEAGGRPDRLCSGVGTDGNQFFAPDNRGNRVLGWGTMPQVNNKNADLLYGQPTFTDYDVIFPPDWDTLRGPVDVAYDPAGAGRLFVSDLANSRVVIYRDPTADSVGDVVLGQPTEADWTGGTAQDRLNQPQGLSWDTTNGQLWVADYNNNRVVRFSPDGGTGLFTTGQNADLVLGQADFTSSSPNRGVARSDLGLYYPIDVTCNGLQVLVADYSNNRVMIWDPLPVADGQAATIVLGQPDFTDGTGRRTRSGLYRPKGVESDGFGVYVSDGFNNRVLIWDSIPGVNGLQADRILGQPTFTSGIPNNGGVSSRSLYVTNTIASTSPAYYASGGTTYLWVPDLENGRILRFDITP